MTEHRSWRAFRALGDELRRHVGYALLVLSAVGCAAPLAPWEPPTPDTPAPPPSSNPGLRVIQASEMAMGEEALGVLATEGFVVRRDLRFRSMAAGLAMVYQHDLPVYVSADAILDALHRAYRDVLRHLEAGTLAPLLERMLDGTRAALPEGREPPEVLADADLILAVAASLLRGAPVEPVAGADPADVRALTLSAEAAPPELATLDLFGSARDVDLSVFRPVGHYTRTEELRRYFRAMRWLAQIDLRLVTYQPDGSPALDRHQARVADALTYAVLRGGARELEQIERVIEGFVGTPDAVTPWALVRAELYGRAVSDQSDEAVRDAYLSSGLGPQRVRDHIQSEGALPLAFAVIPGRYVEDAHVLSEVVYDRVGTRSAPRLMPDPLDVAYAALGNDAAWELLAYEREAHGYGERLQEVREAVEASPPNEVSLYDAWLDALRALSPPEGRRDAAWPSVTRTDAWERRVLSTQLASWSQLRHDASLYAEASTTASFGCRYPDAYVDPYPELWAAIHRYALRGVRVVAGLPEGNGYLPVVREATDLFVALAEVASRLEEMARHELRGEPFTEEQLAFINRAVALDGCALDQLEGWYAELMLADQPEAMPNALVLEPQIADVHTQPTWPGGAPAGRVLHVGTGLPRAMVVTVETCDGPRSYVGPVFSYHEVVTDDFERLDDARFLDRVLFDEPPDVPWAEPFLAGSPNQPPLPLDD